MKAALALLLGVLVLGATAGAASGSGSAEGANVRYVFSFKQGLNRAKLGAATSGYRALFRKAVQLPNIGSGICFGLAYAVSSEAQQARRPDLELYCGEKPQIFETHLASSAFCSTGGTCVGTPGSLKRFAAELKGSAQAVQGMECITGGGTCTSLYAVFGLVNVEIGSANCRTFRSLTAIGPQCVASSVLIYREAPQGSTLSPGLGG
jgi:hypothetical protein